MGLALFDDFVVGMMHNKVVVFRGVHAMSKGDALSNHILLVLVREFQAMRLASVGFLVEETKAQPAFCFVDVSVWVGSHVVVCVSGVRV